MTLPPTLIGLLWLSALLLTDSATLSKDPLSSISECFVRSNGDIIIDGIEVLNYREVEESEVVVYSFAGRNSVLPPPCKCYLQIERGVVQCGSKPRWRWPRSVAVVDASNGNVEYTKVSTFNSETMRNGYIYLLSGDGVTMDHYSPWIRFRPRWYRRLFGLCGGKRLKDVRLNKTPLAYENGSDWY